MPDDDEQPPVPDPRAPVPMPTGPTLEGHDKSAWDEGPWMHEPDRLEWMHRGVPCLMVRSIFGSWCGYVGVEPGHRWYGNRLAENEAEAHGGITWAEPSDVVHRMMSDRRYDKHWWIGFDTNHVWDIAPGMDAQLRQLVGRRAARMPQSKYRDLPYVRAVVCALAEQVIATR